jgi:hypothetical protein
MTEATSHRWPLWLLAVALAAWTAWLGRAAEPHAFRASAAAHSTATRPLARWEASTLGATLNGPAPPSIRGLNGALGARCASGLRRSGLERLEGGSQRLTEVPLATPTPAHRQFRAWNGSGAQARSVAEPRGTAAVPASRFSLGATGARGPPARRLAI